MGRPLQKKWFGLDSLPGTQIVVNGVKFADGTTATNAYIVKQTSSSGYMVQDTLLTHGPETVNMVNASTVGGLNPGECFVLVKPFGQSAIPCQKIMQFRVNTYEADGTAGSYSWSTQPATATGQADLVVAAPANTVSPAVTPSTVVNGATLTTTTGAWIGNPAPTFAYQWKRGVTNVGTNAATYVTVLADVGAGTMTCTVTATNAGGSATATSNAVSVT